MFKKKIKSFFNRKFQVLDRSINVQSDELKEVISNQFKQVESYTQILSLLGFDKPIPPLRGSVISPDAALQVIDHIIEEKPKLIVELGSGVSTLLWAQTLKKFSIESKIIAVDHLSKFANITQRLINKHGLDDSVEIVEAPLEIVNISEVKYEWYRCETIEEILKKYDQNIDLLFVDGPPRNVQNDLYRYPALPILRNYLSNGAAVFLDDAGRDDEKKVIESWSREYEIQDLFTYDCEKGLKKIRVL